jgi:hypothetical protein
MNITPEFATQSVLAYKAGSYRGRRNIDVVLYQVGA